MSLTWFDGAIHDGSLPLSPHDRGLTLGDGLFETILVIGRKAIWHEEHLDRLQASALALGIPFERAMGERAIAGLLSANDWQSAVLRLTLTRGRTGRGLAAEGEHPTIFATLDPFDLVMMFQPARLATSTVRRHQSQPSSHHKTLSYVDQVAAAREAAAKGADDALMLTADGRLSCSTIANLFLLKGKTLLTPSLDQAILPGIARARLIALAPQLGFAVAEKPIDAEELPRADGVFLTNSLRAVRPVIAVDHFKFSAKPLRPLAGLMRQEIGSFAGADLGVDLQGFTD